MHLMRPRISRPPFHPVHHDPPPPLSLSLSRSHPVHHDISFISFGCIIDTVGARILMSSSHHLSLVLSLSLSLPLSLSLSLSLSRGASREYKAGRESNHWDVIIASCIASTGLVSNKCCIISAMYSNKCYSNKCYIILMSSSHHASLVPDGSVIGAIYRYYWNHPKLHRFRRYPRHEYFQS